MKIAAIDVGSNSIKLVVVDAAASDSLAVLAREKETVRLGHDTLQQERLSPDAIGRAVDCIKRFRSIAEARGAERIFAVATASVREARNSAQFIEEVERKAGVSVALIGNAGGGDEEAFNVRNLKQEAGNAVSYGMTWDDALRAVTLAPAEFFGAADRVGSLQPGREGNVVVWSGDPFEFTTRAEHVLVRGVEYRDKTRQDMLIERYRNLPPTHNNPSLE